MIEGKNSFWLGAQAFLLGTHTHEVAWAERSVDDNPAFKFILGKYVEADNANQNKQLWSFASLTDSQPTIKNSPLNMLHAPRAIVGHFVDSEMMFPTQAGEDHPFIEALSCFYAFYFPNELRMVEQAHAEGKLFYSMECISESMTCAGENGCGQQFAYKGPEHSSYCVHLNQHASIKQLDNPHFLAGALIIPPVLPGWRNAKVKELAELVRENAEECEMAYEGISTQFSHLSPAEWETLMLMVMSHAKA
jgi:hypothetical protein